MKIDEMALINLRLQAVVQSAGDLNKAQAIMDFLLGTTPQEEIETLTQQLFDAQNQLTIATTQGQVTP